jgi:DNA-binding HxlR family transcriptional regulator
MPCDHIGPTELIEMAEANLRERDVKPAEGMRFRWSENPIGGMWASIVTEIERHGEQWIVTRLDRNREPLPDGETGFRAL